MRQAKIRVSTFPRSIRRSIGGERNSVNMNAYCEKVFFLETSSTIDNAQEITKIPTSPNMKVLASPILRAFRVRISTLP
jgi:hypothetical protein